MSYAVRPTAGASWVSPAQFDEIRAPLRPLPMPDWRWPAGRHRLYAADGLLALGGPNFGPDETADTTYLCESAALPCWVDHEELLYLTTRDVELLSRGLPVLDLVRDAMVSAREGTSGLAPEAALRWTTPGGHPARSLILPAWAAGGYGCKIINSSLGNRERGHPRAAGIVVLFDPETAAPVCVMEGGRISALRTAAVSVVAMGAVRGLDRLTDVAFLGCGRQAEMHLELLRRFTPSLGRVFVYDKESARAGEFAAVHGAEVAASAQDAVGRATATFAVTTATEPYVELDWLPPGAVFVNVSLDDAAESLLLGCEHLFVDSWELVVDDTHRLLGKLHRAGRIGAPGEPEPAVSAELATLLTGAYPKPVEPDDRIVINPFGMGVNDIVLAAAVYANARASDIGQLLPR